MDPHTVTPTRLIALGCGPGCTDLVKAFTRFLNVSACWGVASCPSSSESQEHLFGYMAFAVEGQVVSPTSMRENLSLVHFISYHRSHFSFVVPSTCLEKA